MSSTDSIVDPDINASLPALSASHNDSDISGSSSVGSSDSSLTDYDDPGTEDDDLTSFANLFESLFLDSTLDSLPDSPAGDEVDSALPPLLSTFSAFQILQGTIAGGTQSQDPTITAAACEPFTGVTGLRLSPLESGVEGVLIEGAGVQDKVSAPGVDINFKRRIPRRA
jgi:hypothetical protein